MKRWHISLLLAGIGVLVTALPAFSQQSPESLLPPGFGEPPAAQQQPAPSRRPDTQAEAPSSSSAASGLPNLESVDLENVSDADLAAILGLPQQRAQRDLPDWARRSPETVGPLEPGNGGLAFDAFGRAHGQFLATLVDRLDAPLPSRWASIVLRRAMLSHIPAPFGIDPVDWVAARAALLLRMGEADGARLLVQGVDVDHFTPRMLDVAADTALATADPAGLCPLTGLGRAKSNRQIWPLADAMCAALEGEASRASALMDQQRRQSNAGNIDMLLAEKVIGAGQNTRRAVTIEWDPVDHVDGWRFGLASATGLVVPDRLMDDAGPAMQAWQARAPMLPVEQRLAASDVAATLGVFSSRSLVELYSLIGDMTDPAEMKDSVADRLRQAYVGSSVGARLSAMHNLWQVDTPLQRHARLILTAIAAAHIPPSSSLKSDVPALLASMLTAGFDRSAARWGPVVANMSGSDADYAWALLALASPRPVVDLSASRIDDFAGRDSSPETIRTKLLVAALAGLGRIPDNVAARAASDAGLRLDRGNRWTLLIDSAGQHRQAATVALLVGVGMQTGDWRGVPPEYLFHILRALRLVGLDYEARMIGAEALSRL
jgi:hypothetical protein